MLNQRNREPNFIEKKRQWKSKMEKPLSRRTLLMILPALILSVFVIMSAPYLKLIVEEFVNSGEEMSYPLKVDTEEDKEKSERAGPPPDPDKVLLDQYRARLEAEGFDWRAKPQYEGQIDLELVEGHEPTLEPVEVELPATMPELIEQSQAGEAPSQ